MVGKNKIELIVYDFDGVMTDNKVLVSEVGVESVVCNRGDGLGINIVKDLGIPQIIISTETNKVVEKRAVKIGLEFIQGSQDKAKSLAEYCVSLNIGLDKVLYIGNDTNDEEVMGLVGFPVCPSDAHASIVKKSCMVLKCKGGDGVIRELADVLSKTNHDVEYNFNESENKSVSTDSKLKRIKSQFEDSVNLRNKILEDDELLQWLLKLSISVVSCLKNGGKIIFAGNGGSFSDAQHLAAEFVGRFMLERGSLAALCLGTNNSTITAVGNDYSFEEIFSRELKGLGSKNDLLVVLSTSGNSKNITKLVKTANEMSVPTYGLLGCTGGDVSHQISSFVVPSSHTGRIQEVHITVGHILCDLVDLDLATELHN